MDAPRRVVVTGLGCVSALGLSAAAFWQALVAGRSGIGPWTGNWDGCGAPPVVARVANYDAGSHFEPRLLTHIDPFAQFALLAAREALETSGLAIDGELAERVGIVLGTATGGDVSVDETAQRIYGGTKSAPHPSTIPRAMANAAVSQISITHKLTGPAFAISSACASATHAIGQAFWMVRHGLLEAAVCGGSEACLTLGSLKSWRALRVMAPDTCRPFSADRKGMVLGEGAGVIVLETLAAARRRGADVLGEIVGFGMSADADGLVRPSVLGPVRALDRALDDAALDPSAIDYVNAHGSGTRINDVTETEAIHRVFGGHAGNLAVSSTKSMHGHALGASGALEFIAAVLALRNGVVPPTANYREADPDCDLDYVPNTARERRLDAAVSTSFAFGGLNAALVARRFH